MSTLFSFTVQQTLFYQKFSCHVVNRALLYIDFVCHTAHEIVGEQPFKEERVSSKSGASSRNRSNRSLRAKIVP